MIDTKRYFKILSISEGVSYIEEEVNLPFILDMLKDCETEGDGYSISVVYLTEEEFKKLPEFMGF